MSRSHIEPQWFSAANCARGQYEHTYTAWQWRNLRHCAAYGCSVSPVVSPVLSWSSASIIQDICLCVLPHPYPTPHSSTGSRGKPAYGLMTLWFPETCPTKLNMDTRDKSIQYSAYGISHFQTDFWLRRTTFLISYTYFQGTHTYARLWFNSFKVGFKTRDGSWTGSISDFLTGSPTTTLSPTSPSEWIFYPPGTHDHKVRRHYISQFGIAFQVRLLLYRTKFRRKKFFGTNSSVLCFNLSLILFWYAFMILNFSWKNISVDKILSIVRDFRNLCLPKFYTLRLFPYSLRIGPNPSAGTLYMEK